MTSMILFDTDFIIAYFDIDQSTHDQSANLLTKNLSAKYFVSNLVFQETATVVSRKFSLSIWLDIKRALKEFETSKIFVTEEDTLAIWTLFESFDRRRISFVDCSNLYLAKKMNLKIASFDQFYPSELLIN